MEPMEDYDGSIDRDTWLDKWKQWWSVLKTVTRSKIDSNEVRCPDEEYAIKMRQRIVRARDDKDSIGGVVTCVIRNLPFGLGEPCFDK
jgi:chorismate synthase